MIMLRDYCFLVMACFADGLGASAAARHGVPGCLLYVFDVVNSLF